MLFAFPFGRQPRLRDYFYFLVDEGFVGFEGAGQLEGVGEVGFAGGDAGDDVGAANPVGFFEVGLGPLGGVVRVGVVEADDVLVAFAGLALDADKFFRVDAVAVLRRVGPGVLAARGGSDGADIAIHLAEEDATAFMGVGLFAVAADFGVVGNGDFQHRGLIHHRVTETQRKLKVKNL
jgi:hypothetical protein